MRKIVVEDQFGPTIDPAFTRLFARLHAAHHEMGQARSNAEHLVQKFAEVSGYTTNGKELGRNVTGLDKEVEEQLNAIGDLYGKFASLIARYGA